MVAKYTIFKLNAYTVSILIQDFDDKDNQIGANFRKGYSNSENGRVELENEIPSPYKDAILMMWGEEPTVFLEES